MILAHRIRMYPNDVQATYFAQACGVARFAYNWALAEWKRLYEAGEKVSEAELRKKLNAIKRQEFPWMMDVTKCAPQLAIKDLGTAFKNFFEGRAQWPQFKKKGRHESFRISNDQFVIEDEKIRIPNLGWVRLAEPLRFSGKIMGATVSRKADEWFVAIQVELPAPAPLHESGEPAVEIRPDPEKFVALSDGQVLEEPKPYRALLARARRLESALSRKVGAKAGEEKSRNYTRARKKLTRLRARISNIRTDALHKITTRLTRSYAGIDVEKPETPAGKRDTLRSMGDMSFFEFRRQLEYKGKITGSAVTVSEGR